MVSRTSIRCDVDRPSRSELHTAIMSNSRLTAALINVVLKCCHYRATAISGPLLKSATLIFSRLALVFSGHSAIERYTFS